MALQKINKYFNKIKAKSPYYFTTVILHPSLKRAYFCNKWKQQPQQWKYTKRCIETLFNEYITEQESEDIKEIIKLQCRKVPYTSSNNSGNKYSQSLLIDKSFTSLYSQKRIKLTTKLNRYYNTGLKFIKIQGKDNSKVNNIIPDPLNQQLIVG